MTDPGHARVVVELEHHPVVFVRTQELAEEVVGIGNHGAELEHGEWAATLADAGMPVQRRTSGSWRG